MLSFIFYAADAFQIEMSKTVLERATIFTVVDLRDIFFFVGDPVVENDLFSVKEDKQNKKIDNYLQADVSYRKFIYNAFS